MNRATPRIIGGAETAKFAYTFLVAMYKSTPSFANQGCGGSLINERLVLTASHCLEGWDPAFPETKAYVGVHRHDLSQAAADEDACSATIEVESIHMHEDYDHYWLTNDVALLLLKENAPCVCSGETATITLDTQTAAERAGTTVTVAGWGNT